jgi:hypothetical protein
VIWRATTRPGVPDLGGYELPGEPGRQDEAAFERWLIERDLAGPERLTVSVLVIREQLDEAGLVQEGVLEGRRGSAEGPYYGNATAGCANSLPKTRPVSRPQRNRWMPTLSMGRTPQSTLTWARTRSFSTGGPRIYSRI